MSGIAHLTALTALLTRDQDTRTLHTRHLQILALICERPNRRSQAEIAELLGIDRSGVSRALDRLVLRDLITRDDDPANRRNVLLAPTKQGRAVDLKVRRFVKASQPQPQPEPQHETTAA